MIDGTHLWHEEDASATTVQRCKGLMALAGKMMKIQVSLKNLWFYLAIDN
jgi:hypothetical protein